MNLHDLDFSRRLPLDFHKTVQMPVFPKLRNSNRGVSLDTTNQTFLTKNKSIVASSFQKSLHTPAKFTVWTEIKLLPFEKMIPFRSYHSAVLHKNNIFIYGGYDINRGNLSEFIIFTVSKNENDYHWEFIPNRGLSPGKLCRHGTFFARNRLYIFGGKRSVYENSNDLYYYDFKEKFWFHVYIPKNDPQPEKIDSFSLCVDSSKEKAIVFGGFFGKFSNDLFYFFINENRWEKIISKGVSPEKRAGHSAVLYNDRQIFVSGGADLERKFNDLWRLNLNNSTWQLVETNEHVYQPGVGHSLILFEDNLIIFGGMTDFIHEKNDIIVHNLLRKSWKKISFESEDDIEMNDPKLSSKRVKKQVPKNGLGFFPRSNTKSPTVLYNSSPPLTFPKRNSLKQIIEDFPPNQSRKESDGFFPEKNGKKIERSLIKFPTENAKFRGSQKSIERSRGLTKSGTSIPVVLKKSPQDPVLMIEKVQNTKKKHLLDEFEVFDERLRRDLLHITPTTEIMKTTIAIFRNPQTKDEGEGKKRKIVASSFDFKKKENVIRVNGNAPCPRDGHSAIVFNQKMIIIGGDRQQRQYNDIFECNLKQLLT